MKRVLIVLALCALATRADDRIASFTNRLAGINGSGNYTFSILYGGQGALAIEGGMSSTSRAFEASVSGTEMLRLRDQSIWLPSSGTTSAVIVRFAQPLILGYGYTPDGSAFLSFGPVPPANGSSLLALNYGGLAKRTTSLSDVRETKDGWRWCETNETPACLELGGTDKPPVAHVELSRIEADRTSVFIHALHVKAGAPEKLTELPAAPRTENLTNFIMAIRFCSSVVTEMQAATAGAKSTADAIAATHAHLDRALTTRPQFPTLPPSLQKRFQPPPGATAAPVQTPAPK